MPYGGQAQLSTRPPANAYQGHHTLLLPCVMFLRSAKWCVLSAECAGRLLAVCAVCQISGTVAKEHSATKRGIASSDKKLFLTIFI